MVTGVVPSPPRFLPSTFIAHRVQKSHCSSIFHRVLLTHALALSASQFVHKKKSQRVYTSMHSARLELTKLTYTRLEDNLIHLCPRLVRKLENIRVRRKIMNEYIVSWKFHGMPLFTIAASNRPRPPRPRCRGVCSPTRCPASPFPTLHLSRLSRWRCCPFAWQPINTKAKKEGKIDISQPNNGNNINKYSEYIILRSILQLIIYRTMNF